ncbi:MAG TPA: hypothetical protein VIT68_04890 [Candidatus Gracilibacteria bacterium]
MDDITIYCPDCRGRFTVAHEEIQEGEIFECLLCGAEVEILQEDPLKVRLFCEDFDF